LATSFGRNPTSREEAKKIFPSANHRHFIAAMHMATLTEYLQLQGGKNWILPKEINANWFF
jgi:hypothetical protein